jgi:6-phosphogluconolactonase/glucosamine-6-phosphate isomerase/deaminase
VDLQVADTAERAAVAAAEWMAHRLRDSYRRRGEATMAVSGGRTPVMMFTALAELDVPWPGVTVFQVDERVAPDGDAARNAPLLDMLPVRRSQVRLMPVTENDLRRAASRYAAQVPDVLDVVHLGLGDDGHTASWPPADAVVDAATRVAMCGQYRGHVRMTLTPIVVNAARSRLVLATGVDKAVPMRDWLLHRAALPIERVRRTGTVVVLDTAAATLLPLPAG